MTKGEIEKKSDKTTIRLKNKDFPDTEKRAAELCQHHGRSFSNLVHWLINEKWREWKK